jgi:hypothetical protein
MKRFALALCLAALTATAQAQSGNERGPQASRHAASSRQAQTPSPVSRLLKWLHDKTQPTKTARKTKAATPKLAEHPKPPSEQVTEYTRAKTESEPEAKPEAKPETKTEAKVDAKAEAKTEAKNEAKVESKPETMA